MNASGEPADTFYTQLVKSVKIIACKSILDAYSPVAVAESSCNGVKICLIIRSAANTGGDRKCSHAASESGFG